MFTTIISLAGLAASAYLGRRELSRRKASGERSGMGWAVAFCVMQLIAALRGVLGMAPDDILSPIVLNFAHGVCVGQLCPRPRVAARDPPTSSAVPRPRRAHSRPTAPPATSTKPAATALPNPRTSPSLDAWGHPSQAGAHCQRAPAPPHRRSHHHPAARGSLCHARTRDSLQPRSHVVLPTVHPARVVAHQRRHDRLVPPVPAPWRRPRRYRFCTVGHRHGPVLCHHVQVHAHPTRRPLRPGHRRRCGEHRLRLHL